jgi:hypothetical protein
MTEPQNPAVPAQAAPTAPADPAPPWGADFDPERAWKLVQDLRTDKERLAARPVLTPEQQQQLSEYNRLVEASKSETQRLTEQAAAAQRDAETAKSEALRWQAAATHGIPAEHFDLLGTGTADEITARAQKLGALLTAQAAAATTPAVPGAPLTRPVEQLRPGASPAGAVDEDEQVYQALFGNRG